MVASPERYRTSVENSNGDRKDRSVTASAKIITERVLMKINYYVEAATSVVITRRFRCKGFRINRITLKLKLEIFRAYLERRRDGNCKIRLFACINKPSRLLNHSRWKCSKEQKEK